jgi:hypothetical protein
MPADGPALSAGRRRLFRFFVVLALVAGCWALVVAATGGLSIGHGASRIRSRSPQNSTRLAIVSAITAWALLPAARRRQALTGEWRSVVRRVARTSTSVREVGPKLVPFMAAAVAVAVVAIAILKGAFVAGGSDSYSYLSQAELWAHGTLRVEQPIVREVEWPFADKAFAPIGYVAAGGTRIVPVTPPGFPIVMAVFDRIAGHRAVFYVVPLLGGLAVWATYLMGCRLAGRPVGLSAAVLLATSPTFLFQLMNPMSDVPAMAWWSLTLALLPCESRGAAFAAGVSAGLAILTRPNLVPVAVVPGLFFLWGAKERTWTGRAVPRALLFAAGAIPFCVAVAALNAFWYGSPVASGYGAFDHLYGWANVWPNLSQYSRWLLETQTPVVLLACVAPFLLRTRVDGTAVRGSRRLALMYLLFIVAVFGCYLLLTPFDAWWYLRYLLPAFPPMFVLTSVGLVALSTRLMGRLRGVVTVAVVVFLAARGIRSSVDLLVFKIEEGQRHFVSIGNYVARRLPERAIIITTTYSGSVRYYSGRLTVLWVWIPGTRLDSAIEELRRLGLHPYFIFQAGEEAEFRKWFQDDSEFAALDWPPIAKLGDESARVYDPADKPAAARGRLVRTEIID